MKAFIDSLKFDAQGLIPAIAQDNQTGDVLMVAWMNRTSLELTLQTRIMHYWSRSRQKLWKKGETSGHLQDVKRVFTDCDRDALLFRIDQKGAACHTGYRTCFYTELLADNAAEKIVSVKTE